MSVHVFFFRLGVVAGYSFAVETKHRFFFIGVQGRANSELRMARPSGAAFCGTAGEPPNH